jgi:hypothetical protein
VPERVEVEEPVEAGALLPPGEQVAQRAFRDAPPAAGHEQRRGWASPVK